MKKFEGKMFLPIGFNICVGAQMNRLNLIETFLLSAYNI